MSSVSDKSGFAEVVFPIPLQKSFVYKIPDRFVKKIKPGCRIIAQFGRRKCVGFVVGFRSTPPPEMTILEIEHILDNEPLINTEVFDLTKWISQYYICCWGEVLNASIPGSSRGVRSAAYIRLIQKTDYSDYDFSKNSLLAGREETIKKFFNLIGDGNWISLYKLKKEIDVPDMPGFLKFFQSKKIVEIKKTMNPVEKRITGDKFVNLDSNYENNIQNLKFRLGPKDLELLSIIKKSGEKVKYNYLIRDQHFHSATIKRLVENGILEISYSQKDNLYSMDFAPSLDSCQDSRNLKNIVLNQEQRKVIEEAEVAVKHGVFQVFLVHGVTGSGKTQVYIELAEKCVSTGKSVLVMVPEIALTPQLLYRFRSVFGNQVGIVHSALGDSERLEIWSGIRDGRFPVVIGVRSAVFSPLNNLGLIVVDEEHDPSYKQNESPMYNARDAAIVRAQRINAVVVLGSATPSLESYFNAINGKYRLLELRERIDKRPLPQVTVVDLKQEMKQGNKSSVSTVLKEQLEKVLKNNEQVILLLNRRGFSTFVQCRECGYLFMCRDCSVSLTYHRFDQKLRCHYCDYSMATPVFCPDCKSYNLIFKGRGTQKIEEELGRLFPGVKIQRLDTDATRRKGSHYEILNAFAMKKSNILVGTQMVAKGHDFPGVTLVGVISSDTGLNIPDFRAGERTFQLLTQAAGRAGRGELSGDVIFQSHIPENYSIIAATKHDYLEFFRQEIKFRQELSYPPCSRLVRAIFEGSSSEVAKQRASSFKQELEIAVSFLAFKFVKILGPSPFPIEKIKKRFHWHLLIKTTEIGLLNQTIRKVLDKTPNSIRNKIRIDVDPAGIF